MKIARSRVFLADDEPSVLESVSQVLDDNGYLTIIAQDIETIFSLNTPIHTIIIDIFMPGMGGIEGIQKIRENYPDAKIIAMSGGWINMDKEQALMVAKKVGADAVLAKPFLEEDLLDTLQEVAQA